MLAPASGSCPIRHRVRTVVHECLDRRSGLLTRGQWTPLSGARTKGTNRDQDSPACAWRGDCSTAARAVSDLDVAETAMQAISPLPSSQSELYSDIILASVPEAIRRLLEARFMQGYKFQSEFARKYFNEAREAGREAGRAEGREEGRSEGLRSAVLTLARSRFDAVTNEDVASLANLHEDVLNELIAVLAKSGTMAEARAAFDRILRRGE
jgi:hypothetical protein